MFLVVVKVVVVVGGVGGGCCCCCCGGGPFIAVTAFVLDCAHGNYPCHLLSGIFASSH